METHPLVYGPEDSQMIESLGSPMVKRPHPAYLLRVTEDDFSVRTNDGVLHACRRGDFVAYDPISGHVWPVAASYVEQHYTVPSKGGTIAVPADLFDAVVENLGYVGQSTVPARSAAAQELAYQLLELRQAAQ